MDYKIKKFSLKLLATILALMFMATPVYAVTKTAETKALYSAAKLKSNFGSKTNPKKGTKPTSMPKPAVNGFMYGDFATFNSLASENKLGGTPIYLLGTVKSLEKLAVTGDVYYGAFLIDDFEGYQWLGVMDVPKSNFDMLKNTYTGMTAYIYGTYNGYSSDMSRPIIKVGLITNAFSVPTPVSTTSNAVASAMTSAIAQSAATPSTSTGVWDNTQLRADGVVYITPTGSKYHYDKECAGKNAIPKYLNDVKGTYGPCGTCVLK